MRDAGLMHTVPSQPAPPCRCLTPAEIQNNKSIIYAPETPAWISLYWTPAWSGKPRFQCWGYPPPLCSPVNDNRTWIMSVTAWVHDAVEIEVVLFKWKLVSVGASLVEWATYLQTLCRNTSVSLTNISKRKHFKQNCVRTSTTRAMKQHINNCNLYSCFFRNLVLLRLELLWL